LGNYERLCYASPGLGASWPACAWYYQSIAWLPRARSGTGHRPSKMAALRRFVCQSVVSPRFRRQLRRRQRSLSPHRGCDSEETGGRPWSADDAFSRLLKPDPWVVWRQQKRAGGRHGHTAPSVGHGSGPRPPPWRHAGLMTSPGHLIPHWAASPGWQPLLMNPSVM
jgi:hypothetical protein